jgi:hypothetical protein
VQADPLGLPFEQLYQVVFNDHDTMVGWRSCLHGLLIKFHAFCMSHGTTSDHDTFGEAASSLGLREWCPTCHAQIVARRTKEMESQMRAVDAN